MANRTPSRVPCAQWAGKEDRQPRSQPTPTASMISDAFSISRSRMLDCIAAGRLTRLPHSLMRLALPHSTLIAVPLARSGRPAWLGFVCDDVGVFSGERLCSQARADPRYGYPHGVDCCSHCHDGMGGPVFAVCSRCKITMCDSCWCNGGVVSAQGNRGRHCLCEPLLKRVRVCARHGTAACVCPRTRDVRGVRWLECE